MLSVTATNADRAYLGLIEKMIEHSKVVEDNRELYHVTLELVAPERRIVTYPARAVNPAYLAARTAWVFGNTEDQWLVGYHSSLSKQLDDKKFIGAYGNRIRLWEDKKDQLAEVIRKLRASKSDKKAVIQIFNPIRDNKRHKSVPQAISLHFLIHDGYLDMRVHMSVTDLWFDLPYDLFAFGTVQELMAKWLGSKVGLYYHSMGCMTLPQKYYKVVNKIPWDFYEPIFYEVPALTTRYDNLKRHLYDCFYNLDRKPTGDHFWDDMILTMRTNFDKDWATTPIEKWSNPIYRTLLMNYKLSRRQYASES